jgi:hypothetical protein
MVFVGLSGLIYKMGVRTTHGVGVVNPDSKYFQLCEPYDLCPNNSSFVIEMQTQS